MASSKSTLSRKEQRAQRRLTKALAKNHGRMPASLSDALSGDDSLPLDSEAKEYTSPITSSGYHQFNGGRTDSFNGRFAFL